MNKIFAFGAAAVIAVASLTATAASAQDWQHQQGNHHSQHSNNGHHYRNGGGYYGNGLAPFALGAVLGLGVGSAINNSYYGGGSAHVEWCREHYRTYNPQTNTYFARGGVARTCNSPYEG